MSLILLGKGLIMGFAIAAPVGPIGLLCIRRTLSHGMLVGFVSGLGTACADALYGLLAALGVTAVTGFLTAHYLPFQLVGGLFLCYLGYAGSRSASADTAGQPDQARLPGIFGSSFLLTLSNPLTIASFLAVFATAGFSPSGAGFLNGPVLLVVGVFFGSLCWWLLLSAGVSLFSRYVTAHALRLINLTAGCMIACMGLLACLSSAYRILLPLFSS